MSQGRDTIVGMGTPSESDTPAPSQSLDEWIASLTNLDRLRDAGTITFREYIEAMPAFSDESRRRTAARLQAQSEAQRQDRVMAYWMGRAAHNFVDDPLARRLIERREAKVRAAAAAVERSIYGPDPAKTLIIDDDPYRRPWLDKDLVRL